LPTQALQARRRHLPLRYVRENRFQGIYSDPDLSALKSVMSEFKKQAEELREIRVYTREGEFSIYELVERSNSYATLLEAQVKVTMQMNFNNKCPTCGTDLKPWRER
jgi:hypothetical protein